MYPLSSKGNLALIRLILIPNSEIESRGILHKGIEQKSVGKMQYIVTHCQGTFNIKESTRCFLLPCAVSQGPLISLSVPGKQEQAELHAVLRTEVTRQITCVDSFQCPFTLMKSIQSPPYYSGYGLSSWPCDDCSSPSFVFTNFIFAKPKALVWIYIKAHTATNKVALFHLRLGSLRPFVNSSPPGPSL